MTEVRIQRLEYRGQRSDDGELILDVGLRLKPIHNLRLSHDRQAKSNVSSFYAPLSDLPVERGEYQLASESQLKPLGFNAGPQSECMDIGVGVQQIAAGGAREFILKFIAQIVQQVTRKLQPRPANIESVLFPLESAVFHHPAAFVLAGKSLVLFFAAVVYPWLRPLESI